MTKYVINSGNVRGDKGKAKKYFAEVFKDLGNEPKVLLCSFANPREEWEDRFQNYIGDFHNYLAEGVRPIYKMAMPAEFVEQSKEADIIWINGGDDDLVKCRLSKFNLKDIWKGKVIAVSSASSDVVASSFWTCDWRKCFEGFGLVPIKFIPHFNSDYGNSDPRGAIDWGKAKEELAKYGDKSLPIYSLEEGDFAVFEMSIH